MPNMSTPRLKEMYISKIVPELKDKLSLKNNLQVPRLTKVVLNMGLGEAAQDSKVIQAARDDLSVISGQMPITTTAKKSIATYKTRTGMPLGVKVTLRGNTMYEFIDRLITISLPRIRDFRGLKKNSFDGQGNYALGIQECTIFPEINVDRLDKIRGLDIVICTSATTDAAALSLLQSLNFPIKEPNQLG
ncbi:MAG: 50S ribosomal protein L5 [Candidatus Pelagibacterales bacterium]|jgi:large subunit ribosomal protein L5|tara:strand:+ start:21104 stop:21673 length:570 start_codon:yes stop_codon:yes gene_type:complete